MPLHFQTITVWHNPLAPRPGGAGVPPASLSTTVHLPDIAFIPVAEAQAETEPESGTEEVPISKPEQLRQTPGGVLRLGVADPQPGEAHEQGEREHSQEKQAMSEENGNLWIWKVAAVAITLTAASLAARRAMPWAASGLRRGGLVTLECLAAGKQNTLNALVKPLHGRLSRKGNAYVYQPKANRKGRDSFTYATEAGVATLRLMLEAETKAFTRVAYVLNDALPTRQGVPLRLTVQSEREAPTLTLTDRALGSLLVSRCGEGETVMLAGIEATAQNPENTLKVELSNFPEGSILSDGNNTFTATTPNAGVEITNWCCDQLTLIPPQACPADFILRVQVTETCAQKTLVTTAGLRVMTKPFKENSPDDPDEATEKFVATRPGASATITIRSMPKPPAPACRQGGYIILNHGPHAKPRKADKPKTAPRLWVN
jgi:hypothetical protein